ncbi:MAG: PorP/SprF family type IX secretion system membrane protein [Bacteroidetes bacterium]|nr:PorP/SprF family type IX secretion system membrane protein [Bacteroidota bacterium]
MKKIISLFSTLAAFTVIAAQDFHFSQYDITNLIMSPASTGMYDGQKGDYRVTSDFRSQWKALGIKPYTTAYISYDMLLHKWNNKFGVGGYLVEDHSGVGKFQTLNAMASGSYNIMDGTNEHYLTVGLQTGIFYKSFDQNSYTYDVQWDNSTGTFDQNIYNQENFARTSMVKFDADLGVRYRYMPLHKKYHPFASFSLYHLTVPNESFTEVKSRVPLRANYIAGCDYDINENFSIQPRILYMNQRKAHELNFGVLAFYKIKGSSLDALAGVDYRVKDAVVFHLGFRQGQSIFRFSYDLNTSYLSNYSGGRGAWEFSLLLMGTKGKPILLPMF